MKRWDDERRWGDEVMRRWSDERRWNGRPQFPLFEGVAEGRGSIWNCFLEQPRRGKTHEVQLTPHKAKPQCGARGRGSVAASRRDATIIHCSVSKKCIFALQKWSNNMTVFAVEHINNHPKKKYIRELVAWWKTQWSQETFSLRNSGDFFRKIVIVDGNAKPWTDEDGIMYMGVIPFGRNGEYNLKNGIFQFDVFFVRIFGWCCPMP